MTEVKEILCIYCDNVYPKSSKYVLIIFLEQIKPLCKQKSQIKMRFFIMQFQIQIQGSQRVHIHCNIEFWHICFTPPSLSLSFSVSLQFSPTNCPIYHSLSYPPHRSNSLKRKERKEGKRVRDEEGMREIDGGVCG